MAQRLETANAKLREAILEVEGKHHEELSSMKQQAQTSYDKLQVELSAAKPRIFKLENEKAAEMDALRTQPTHDCQGTVNAVTLNAVSKDFPKCARTLMSGIWLLPGGRVFERC